MLKTCSLLAPALCGYSSVWTPISAGRVLRDKGYRHPPCCSATLFMFTVVELSGRSFRTALRTYRQAACNNAPAPWELLFSRCLGFELLSRSGIVNFCLSFVEGNTALTKCRHDNCRHFLVMHLKLLLPFCEDEKESEGSMWTWGGRSKHTVQSSCSWTSHYDVYAC